jgi:hypothetical protein
MIKITTEICDGNDLQNEFRKYDRHNSFTSEGFNALFDLLNDLGEDYELDVIGVCCDFSQDDLESVLKNYSLGSFEELQDNTIAIMLNNGDVLYQNY